MAREFSTCITLPNIYPALAEADEKEPPPNGVLIEPALALLLAKEPPPNPGYVLPPHLPQPPYPPLPP